MIQTLTIKGDNKESELKMYKAFSNEEVTQTRFNNIPHNSRKQFPVCGSPTL